MTPPDTNGWIISAVLVLVGAAFSGLLIFTIALSKVRRRSHPPILWLLILSISLMACATFVEQTRVLFFRLSFDGLLPAVFFDRLYRSAFDVVLFKLIAAVALTIGATVKLSLIRGYDDADTMRCVWHALAILGWLYIGMAVIIELVFP